MNFIQGMRIKGPKPHRIETVVLNGFGEKCSFVWTFFQFIGLETKLLNLCLLIYCLIVQSAFAKPINKVAFLEDNISSLVARLEILEVERIKKPIMILYELHADEVGLTLLKRLIDIASKGGTDVKLVLDYFGSKGFPREYLDYAVEKGVQIKWFNSPRLMGYLNRPDKRMHDKLVSNEFLETVGGGRNGGNMYYGLSESKDSYEDFDYYLEGNEGEKAREHQLEIWGSSRTAKYRPGRVSLNEKHKIEEDLKRAEKFVQSVVEDSSSNWRKNIVSVNAVEFIGDSPIKGEKSGSTESYFDAIKQASHSIQSENQYLLLGGEAELFRDLVERGVDVDLLYDANGFERPGFLDKITATAIEDNLDLVAKTGARIFERREEIFSHAKLLTIDNEVCFIWSFNIDPRSRNLNLESGIKVIDKNFCGRVSESLNRRKKRYHLAAKNGFLLRPKREISTCMSLFAKILKPQL